ncbi:MAG: class I SAM-dependent methyltransferase [Gammaproteobacteria bacterium]|nr:class I SAM-dependent methyltransferase [Gammaproteobacteria bacterium]
MKHWQAAILSLGMSMSGAAQAALDADTAKILGEAMTHQRRAEGNTARDVYRHPMETLDFFGLKRDMTVVEIWPGGGWYAELLAPVLAEQGSYYAAHFPAGTKSEYFRKTLAKFQAKLAADPAYAKVKLTEFSPPAKLDIAPKASADLVLTFRNVHNWMKAGAAKEAFQAMYQALKPGGVLGVVEHRLPADRPQSEQAESGYVQESYVIDLAEAAGFKLEARSEINANPKDTADHEGGVWSLPPTLDLGEKDKAKYLAIGESDRMTLKFVKPR